MHRFLLLVLLCALPLSAADDMAAGRAALDRDDNEKAIELFTKVIAAQPKNAEAHYRRGMAYGDLAQRSNILKQASLATKTKADFERAAELDPNHLETRFMLINFYLLAPGFMGGGEDKAVAQAAEIKKRDALDGHRAYARVYSHQKKNDLARKEYVDAVRENPKSARAHYMLAGFLINNDKNWTGALPELDMALKLDPSFMPAYLRLGAYAALSQSNYARGEEALRKYLTHKPGDNEPPLSAAWYWLGRLQEVQGKKNEARQSYRNALKLAPNDKTIKEALKKLG
jgi:tetratricopeptide (TPR) repeat protein